MEKPKKPFCRELLKPGAIQLQKVDYMPNRNIDLDQVYNQLNVALNRGKQKLLYCPYQEWVQEFVATVRSFLVIEKWFPSLKKTGKVKFRHPILIDGKKYFNSYFEMWLEIDPETGKKICIERKNFSYKSYNRKQYTWKFNRWEITRKHPLGKWKRARKMNLFLEDMEGVVANNPDLIEEYSEFIKEELRKGCSMREILSSNYKEFMRKKDV